MKRRTFVKGLAAAGAVAPIMIGGLPVRASSTLPQLAQLASVENDKILIIIQLFGGNDGLNTVIPADDDTYYKIRPAIGIPKNKTSDPFGGTIYLNKALESGSQGGIVQMLKMGTLAVVQGIGYPNPNLSHFRSTDIWLSGINNSDPNVRLDTGWVGRYLEKVYPDFPGSLPSDPLAIQFGGFGLTLVSSKGRMGIEVGDPSAQRGLTSVTDELDANSANTHYALEYDFIADIANRSNKYAKNVQNAYAAGKTKLSGKYGNDTLSAQMAATAALIAGGLQTKAYVVGMGGFDTHVTQQTDPLNGQHPTLLGRLANAVSQFMYDMTKLGHADRVIGLTISEFGRRPQENGSFGTDHGAASVQFVFGTQVNSGVFGHTPELSNLNENGDLLYQYDYRQVYADILMNWFGQTLKEAQTILQDDTIVPIDVIKPQASGVAQQLQPNGITLSNYPNPFTARTTFDFDLNEATYAKLEISNSIGEVLEVVTEKYLATGHHTIDFSKQLPSGVYFATLYTGKAPIVKRIECLH